MDTLRYNGDAKSLLTIREYTGYDQKKKSRIISEIGEKYKDQNDMLIDGILAYAPCVSCTDGGVVLADGSKLLAQDLTLDEYLKLPGALLDQWAKKVFAVNPSWSPDYEADVPEKKT